MTNTKVSDYFDVIYEQSNVLTKTNRQSTSSRPMSNNINKRNGNGKVNQSSHNYADRKFQTVCHECGQNHLIKNCAKYRARMILKHADNNGTYSPIHQSHSNTSRTGNKDCRNRKHTSQRTHGNCIKTDNSSATNESTQSTGDSDDPIQQDKNISTIREHRFNLNNNIVCKLSNNKDKYILDSGATDNSIKVYPAKRRHFKFKYSNRIIKKNRDE